MKRCAVVLLGTILSHPLAHSAEVSASAPDGGASPTGDARRPAERGQSGVNLIAFVGRRIEVRCVEPPPDEIPFNAEYRVRAEVLQVVFGSYSRKEITFSSYVHMGPAAFEKDEFGLVYVSAHEGRFVQEKYLFQPVHPTADGRWAGCGDPYGAMADMHRHGVKAEAVTFRPPVVFDTAKMSKHEVERRYPEPFFRRQGEKAICLMGNYPAELFRVMKEGYLTARGVFGRTPEHTEPSNSLPRGRPHGALPGMAPRSERSPRAGGR
jgi:hypothetical protein